MIPENVEKLYISLWFMEARADGLWAIGALVAIVALLLIFMFVLRPQRS